MRKLSFDLTLLKIYRKTFFQVKDTKGRLIRFTIRTLGKHPDLSRKTFAVMTAWNPMNRTLPLKVNRDLNKKLANMLKRHGVPFYRTDGWLGRHREEGFTVEGIRVAKAVRLGRKFHQYAILYNDWRGPRFLRCSPGHLFDGNRA